VRLTRFARRSKPEAVAYQPRRRKPGPFGSGIPAAPIAPKPRIIKLKRRPRPGPFGMGLFDPREVLAMDFARTLGDQWNGRKPSQNRYDRNEEAELYCGSPRDQEPAPEPDDEWPDVDSWDETDDPEYWGFSAREVFVESEPETILSFPDPLPPEPSEEPVTIFVGEARAPGEVIPPRPRKARLSAPKTLHQRSVASRTVAN
jgi:hypothetical protein